MGLIMRNFILLEDRSENRPFYNTISLQCMILYKWRLRVWQ